MSLNYLEIEQILNELSLEGSYLQKIHQPTKNKLVLQFFKKKSVNVLICLQSQEVRLHQTWQKHKNPIKLPRFAQLLRARIQGSRLTKIYQVEHNRLVKMVFEQAQATYFLWLKLWTNQANVLLSDPNNRIIDCFFRKPSKNEISGQIWAVPAPSILTQEYRLRFDASSNYSQQLEKFYSENEKRVLMTQKLNSYKQALNQQEKHTREALIYLDTELENGRQQLDLLKVWANLLFSYNPSLDGLKVVTLETLEIPTHDFKEAKLLAKNHLRTYKKLKEKIKYQELKYLSLQEKLRKYHEGMKELELNFEEVSQDFWQKYGLSLKIDQSEKLPKHTNKPSIGLKFVSSSFTITLGRNAKENDELLRHYAKAQDMWLHLRDFPGCYAFISSKRGKTFPLEVLLDAGNLALYFSHKRKIVSADFYYTLVKNLRRAKGAKLGMVIPNKEKNLHLILDEKRLQRLLNSKGNPTLI